MRNRIMKNLVAIVAWILFAMLCISVVDSIDKSTKLAKKDITIEYIKEQSEKLVDLAWQQSLIEKLSETAESNRLRAEENLEDIKQLQKDYEINILTYRCYKDQVNRLMNNEEADDTYCWIDSNLEQYRLKKY